MHGKSANAVYIFLGCQMVLDFQGTLYLQRYATKRCVVVHSVFSTAGRHLVRNIHVLCHQSVSCSVVSEIKM